MHRLRSAGALTLAALLALSPAEAGAQTAPGGPALDPESAALAAVGTPAWDQAVARFEATLARDVAEDAVGSISAAVFVGDSVVWGDAYGWADRDRRIPADTTHVYRTGSISKTFTAALLARLAEKGVVSLDDPVEKYLPEVRGLAERPPASQPITLRQLASHTAGLIREPELDGAASGPIEGWREKILASIPATSFRTMPGAEYHYSNIGFGMLGLALERAAGKPFMELVEEEIMEPLAMGRSGFMVDDWLRPHLAAGYANRRDGSIDAETPAREHRGRGYKVPNGGVYATVNDLARFAAGLTGPGILDAGGRAEMTRVQTPGDTVGGYGLGLSIQTVGGRRFVGHGGSVAGYTAYLLVEPESRVGVALLRNYNSGRTSLGGAARDLLLELTAAAPLDPSLASRTDAIFAEWDRPGSPGCAVGVYEDGRIAYARGYGYADLDHDLTISPSSVFYLASMSKQFTAGSVALASLQGKLTLDDDIRRWFPELPDYGRTITVRHLVHHISGLRDYLTLMGLADMPLARPWEVREVLDLVARQRGLNFDPGSEYTYSNTGYLLLSELVRRATGKSLREYAREEVFGPLGMRDTHFHDDRGMLVPGRALSYASTDPDDEGAGRPQSSFRLAYLANFDQVGSGGLMSSVLDLFAWDREFYRRSLGGGDLVPLTLTRGVLASGDTLGYAFGLSHGDYRGLPTVGHGGSMMGFKTNLLRFPDERFTAVTLCNLGSIDPGELNERVADVWLGDRLGPAPERTRPRFERAEERELEAPAGVAGSYRSEELAVSWTIVRDGEGLALRRGGGEPRELRVTGPDTLRAGGWTLRLERDGAGVVSGFVLDAGRARGLRFERVEG